MLGWNHARVTVETFGVKESGSDGTYWLQIAGNVAYRDAAGRIWALNPFLVVDEDNATFGLAVGGVLPM